MIDMDGWIFAPGSLQPVCVCVRVCYDYNLLERHALKITVKLCGTAGIHSSERLCAHLLTPVTKLSCFLKQKLMWIKFPLCFWFNIYSRSAQCVLFWRWLWPRRGITLSQIIAGSQQGHCMFEGKKKGGVGGMR